MQIHRIDLEPHAYATPKGPTRPHGEDLHVGSGSAGSVAGDSSAPLAEKSDKRLASLVEQLQGAPETRPDVMEAARAKVASGEFLTRQSAEQLATLLQDKFF